MPRSDKSHTAKVPPRRVDPINPKWPKITRKSYLPPPEWLVADQVAVQRNFLTSKECQAILQELSSVPLTPSPAAKKGEAYRTNGRAAFHDPAFARKLWEESGLQEIVRDWPSIDSTKQPRKRPQGLNCNLRIYRYEPGQLFGCHYDDHVVDAATGLTSEWTLLIYLTGTEDGVEGGETVFYLNHSRKSPVVASLERGAALLHRHGRVCMLHEGRPVMKGIKYVLRSDLLFG